MTEFVLMDAYVAVGAVDIRGFTNNLSLTETIDLPESTAMGQLWRTRLHGLRDTTMNLQGFWDAALDLTLFTAIGSEDPTPVSFSGRGTEALRAFTFKSRQTNYNRGGSVGEIYSYTIDANGHDPLINGLLAANRTVIIDGVGPSLELGPLTAGQTLFASFHVTANAGIGQIDAVVQSDDNSGFTSAIDQITFDTVTTVNGAQFLSVAGPITDSFWRLSWDLTGVGASFNIFSVIGIAISN